MWGLGNVVTKRIGKVNLVSLVVWGSLIPPLPFLALSLMLEGPAQIDTALRNISLSSVLVIAYLAFIATLLGYGLWSRLLSRYPASQVAPFSLLVPIVGLSSAWLFLGEALSSVQWIGAAIVMLGLLINVFGPRLLQRLRGAAA